MQPTYEDINRLIGQAFDYRLKTHRSGVDPDPQLGDLVVVTHTPVACLPEQCLGVYESCWTYVYPPESGEPFAERCREVVRCIRTLSGDLVTWTNVMLWKVVG